MKSAMPNDRYQCNMDYYYYMANSASGQDDSNRGLWLATRAGKMEPSCPPGTTPCIPQAKLPRKPYNKSFIDQVCTVKMAGYWPHSFFSSLWTSTSSRSINTQQKNEANIQPSWPHTWSITHTSRLYRYVSGDRVGYNFCPCWHYVPSRWGRGTLWNLEEKVSCECERLLPASFISVKNFWLLIVVIFPP